MAPVIASLYVVSPTGVGGRDVLLIVNPSTSIAIVCTADWYTVPPRLADESIDGVVGLAPISTLACDILCWNDGSVASTPALTSLLPLPLPLFSPLAVVVDTSGLITLYASLEKNLTLWPVPGVFLSLKIDLVGR